LPAGQGDQHHLLAPRLLADAASRVVAVQTWESDVEQYEVGAKFFRRVDRREAIVRGSGFIAEFPPIAWPD
jgi:hypothetical protein